MDSSLATKPSELIALGAFLLQRTFSDIVLFVYFIMFYFWFFINLRYSFTMKRTCAEKSLSAVFPSLLISTIVSASNFTDFWIKLSSIILPPF